MHTIARYHEGMSFAAASTARLLDGIAIANEIKAEVARLAAEVSNGRITLEQAAHELNPRVQIEAGKSVAQIVSSGTDAGLGGTRGLVVASLQRLSEGLSAHPSTRRAAYGI